MNNEESPLSPHAPDLRAANAASGFWQHYTRIPLAVRILVAMVLGIVAGELLGKSALGLKPFSDLVLQLLRLLATPLIFFAVVQAIVRANVSGKTAGRLAFLLISNTLVAIGVGLLVANVIRPGAHMPLTPTADSAAVGAKPFNIAADLLDKIPANTVDPWQKNEIISVIIVAIALGIALRGALAAETKIEGATGARTLVQLLDTGFRLIMTMLHWLFAIVPLAVFAVVARTVGTQGVGPLVALGGFVLTVVVALGLQAVFYLTRLRMGSWVRPGRFLSGASDALALAFSTASSAAALPVTFDGAKNKIGVRESSASLGVMVGGTFNHDGTALYEAMAALFISQALGKHLGLPEQITVVLMSVVASVGAAGIPEAGLVTMLAVFNAVHLPIEFIPLLLPLDWFLDRCRTTINVMGDLTVTCLLDGKTPPGDTQNETKRADAEVHSVRPLAAESDASPG